jgi:C1A family cysteine protease
MAEAPNEYRLEIAPPLRARRHAPGILAGSRSGSIFGDVFPGDGPLGDVFRGDGALGDAPPPNGGLGSSAFITGAPTLRVGLGYRCDIPDHRDFTLARAKQQLAKSHARALDRSHLFGKRHGGRLKAQVDLRSLVPGKRWPVENQGQLHACTAHAATGLIEFMVNRAEQKSGDLSRLFLYKSTRSLMRTTGDSGATLRATFRAIQAFGLPPEDYWPYDLTKFDAEPNAFLYSFCDHYKSLLYTRLDDYGLTGAATCTVVKQALSDGLPVSFGFPVYSSVGMGADIPLPSDNDRQLGGHAVLAVGYDDHHRGQNQGSFLFRNSWGQLWGDGGYGYLPYEYVERQWALDFWTVFRKAWLNSKKFGEPADFDSAT